MNLMCGSMELKLLRFVDLIFPGGAVDISTYLNHHLTTGGNVGMAKDSKCSM